jgi:putative ABC transport system ATP-binding protein
MSVVIELDQVHKVYDTGAVRVHALRGVSLSILAGEFVAIRGSSGSGKSTLMNLLGCLDHPTSGIYKLDGHDIVKMSRKQLAQFRNRKLGFIFQGFNLLQRYSAVENVELPLIYSGVPAALRHRKALEMLELVGLKERSKHHPNQLSGGQQQRVAIARALINDPQILLADEPTGNLDSKTSTEILREFERLNHMLGQTIVMVTHDPATADHAPRQITIKDGLVDSDINRSDQEPHPSAEVVEALPHKG